MYGSKLSVKVSKLQYMVAKQAEKQLNWNFGFYQWDCAKLCTKIQNLGEQQNELHNKQALIHTEQIKNCINEYHVKQTEFKDRQIQAEAKSMAFNETVHKKVENTQVFVETGSP